MRGFKGLTFGALAAGVLLLPGLAGPVSAGESQAVQVDACATGKDKLGLSRIVEIDTEGGPEFGGSHGSEGSWLKDHEIVLTFDDGPLRPFTRPILKALADHCTKATFFMVGRMAAADPGLVKDIAAAGHTIGSHTNSHQNLKAIGWLRGRQEVDGGAFAVAKAKGGPIAPFFRFPFLSGSHPVETYLKSQNLATFWVDIDAKDYTTRDSDIVRNRIMAQLRAERRGIILMHDIQPSTAHGIKDLLDQLHKEGFKVVHIVPKTGLPASVASSAHEPDTKVEPAATSSIKRSEPASVTTAARPQPKDKTTAGAAKEAAASGAQAVDPPKVVIESEPEILPWQTREAKTAVPPAKVARSKPAPAKDNSSWFANIFSN